MPWYRGPTLLDHLDSVEVDRASTQPFRLAVQWINRSGADFRGYAGTVLSGSVRAGDEIVVQPSGTASRIARIVTQDGDLAEAVAGQAVTLTLADAVDVARGAIFASPDRSPHVADQFACHLVWMDDAPMLPGRPYLLQLGTATMTATVTELKHRIDVETGVHEATKQLALNEIGFANIALDRSAPFDGYDENRDTGGFILIDRTSNATVGAGMIRFPLRRASNLPWQAFAVDKPARARIKHQRPCVLWFTGLSGAGKSTIADGVEKRLLALGRHTYSLDGDNVRHGLNRDLGFTDADRVENVRRVIEVARLFCEAGLIVLVSVISPFRSERRLARERMAEGEFVEVFVDTPFDECERRDPKGLYRRAREGKITNFTGIDSPYETPESPDIHIRTTEMSLEGEIESIMSALRDRGIIG